jgi:hypothetical protein
MKLKIEMIPTTAAWNKPLRTGLKKSDWDKIRKAVYAKQNMHCHICGEQPPKSLDAHEVWDFDEENHIQRLVDIIGVCKSCHIAIHFERAQTLGFEREAREQLIKVNNCTESELKEEISRTKDDYIRRSRIENWKLDLSLIEEQGCVVKESANKTTKKNTKGQTCVCENRQGVYSVLKQWGYWLHCSDCRKKIEDEFHYYNEPDDLY